jgi:hypothetical protein
MEKVCPDLLPKDEEPKATYMALLKIMGQISRCCSVVANIHSPLILIDVMDTQKNTH